MKTANLELLPQTPSSLLALIESVEAFEKSSGLKIADGIREMYASGDVSPEFFTMLKSATAADPWTFGFLVLHAADRLIIGTGGFKGPPGADGVVEIAYGIAPGYRGRGFATEVARALTAYALGDSRVRVICAHTRPEPNASTRVLAKSGFRFVEEVNDPEDGLVWRWDYAGLPQT